MICLNADNIGRHADEERASARLSPSALIAWLLVYLIILLMRSALLICTIAPRSGAIVLLTCRRRYPKNYQKSDELSQNNN